MTSRYCASTESGLASYLREGGSSPGAGRKPEGSRACTPRDLFAFPLLTYRPRLSLEIKCRASLGGWWGGRWVGGGGVTGDPVLGISVYLLTKYTQRPRI